MACRPGARAGIALCTVILATALTVAPAAPSEPAPDHRPPLDAPIVDGFRPPTSPYGPGNRGLEYGSEPGAEVGATADGTVVFAGAVAGTLHVTVRHRDGVRTSYSFLSAVSVAVGQRVRQGDRLGTTAGRLHLGARRGAAYFDPRSLFEGGAIARVHLVPFDDPPAAGEAGERSALRQLVGAVGTWAGDRLLAGTGATVAWLRDNGAQLLRTAEHYLEPMPNRLLRRGLTVWRAARAAADRPCTPVTAAPPRVRSRRVAVLVGGLGSTSEAAAIDDVDTRALGYDGDDVLRFSYAGGRTPGTGAAFAAIPDAAYAADATQGDLRASGHRLADLVESVAEAADGAPVDLLAHSQGGIVARIALAELERRHGPAWMERLGLVATLGTPHDGADLATAVFAVGSTGLGSAAFDEVGSVLALELDDDATAVGQLSETSALVRELRSTPLPEGVRAVSIAARGDVVVPVPRTAVAGATQVVVPIDGARAHDALPGSGAAHRELALALAQQPPTCTSFADQLAGQVVGEAISWGEDALGALGWIGAVRYGKEPLGG